MPAHLSREIPKAMIRIFPPLILPFLLVTVFALVSYRFWKTNTEGSAMKNLASVSLGGQTMEISHPTGGSPTDPGFAWRISLSTESLRQLGSLELAYGEEQPPASPDAWVGLPTGTAFGAFRAAPPLPASFSTERLRLWVRAKTAGNSAPVSIGIGGIIAPRG